MGPFPFKYSDFSGGVTMLVFWIHSVLVPKSSGETGGLLPLHLDLPGHLALDTTRKQHGDTAVTATVPLIWS